jgi:1-acyl-sn-glycerol-3-phosphate acyltransferase
MHKKFSPDAPRVPLLGSERVFARVRSALAAVFRVAILAAVHVVTGVHLKGPGKPLGSARPGIYFANHTSLADFLVIWVVMPASLRSRVRPVAAADFWQASALRRFIARDVFKALLIERAERPTAAAQPSALALLSEALQQGDSLIFFPEGTRNTTDDALQPFKSGLYHLARAHPEAALVPVWLDNIRHVMPKGCCLPVPTLCAVHMGTPGGAALAADGQSMAVFLAQAQRAVLALKPGADGAWLAPVDAALDLWRRAA